MCAHCGVDKLLFFFSFLPYADAFLCHNFTGSEVSLVTCKCVCLWRPIHLALQPWNGRNDNYKTTCVCIVPWTSYYFFFFFALCRHLLVSQFNRVLKFHWTVTCKYVCLMASGVEKWLLQSHFCAHCCGMDKLLFFLFFFGLMPMPSCVLIAQVLKFHWLFTYKLIFNWKYGRLWWPIHIASRPWKWW